MNIKFYIYLIISFCGCILCSCVANRKYDDLSFGWQVDEFYFAHLRYPSNIDEFRYLTFREDSINHFEELSNKAQAYDLNAEDAKNEEEASLISFMMDTSIVKKTMDYDAYYKVREIINFKIRRIDYLPTINDLLFEKDCNYSFNECLGYIYLKDKNGKTLASCKKTEKLIREYTKNYSKESTPPIFVSLKDTYKRNKMMRMGNFIHTSVYRKLCDDSFIRIHVSEKKREQIKRVDSLINNIVLSISSENKNPSFLQYDKKHGYSNCMQKGRVPEVITENKQLMDNLNDLLTISDTEYVRFMIHSNYSR